MENQTNQTTAISPVEKTARTIIQAAQKGFEACQSELSFAREAQFAVQIIKGNEALLKCDHDSVKNSIINVAQVGLTLNPALKLAYLVPRKGKCTLDISYIGMIEIAINSGIVKNITADVICENDDFDYQKGTNPYIKHKPALSTRGEIIGAYAIAFLIGGGTHFEIMGKDEVLKAKQTSQTDMVWKAWESEMWKKTVIRRLFKYLKKGLNEKLINMLQIDNEIIQADYQNETKNADKFSDFELID